MDETLENAERLGAEVRDAYRAGESPSALIRSTFAQVPNRIFLMMVFRVAFGLSIPQGKAACAYWGPGASTDGIDDARMDGYLRPLIEGLRPTWDRPS